jgi:septal ring factor EnvC (AmiA/AmiB activator)
LKIACLILLLSLSCTSFAAHEKTKLQQITAKIASLKKSLFSKTEQKQSLSDELESLDKKINLASLKVHAVQEKIKLQNKKLKPLLRQQKKLQQQLAAQRQALSKQLVAIYQAGQHSYMQLFLNQQDPSQLSRLTTYYQALNKARSRLIADFMQNLTEVEHNQKAINVVIDNLQQLKQKRLQEQKKLQQQQRTRKRILRTLNQQINSSKHRIAGLEKNKRHLQNVINNLNAQKAYANLAGVSFYRLRHKLPWPVKGRITRNYRQRYDDRLLSNGVFISAPENRSVRAIASGQVIFANWLRGYGNMLIINHKGGYMTLYAHNNALLVQVGDKVKPGEQIALVGNSGGLIKSGLYFEVRYKGKTRNPALWCH